MRKSFIDIILTAPPEWVDGTLIERTDDGKWQVTTPSRFGRGKAVETNESLMDALRDAWGPYEADDLEDMLA